jgi:hypothetical protein
MSIFQFYYNLNKHVPVGDSWLGLYPTSWTIAAIGPLARVTFMVLSLASEHNIKSGNFSSRSDYRTIGKHWSNALIEPDFMCWNPLVGFMLSSILTALKCFSWCCSGLMMCSTHLDESVIRVKSCAIVTSMYTFYGHLDSLLDRLDSQCTMHGSQSIAINW